MKKKKAFVIGSGFSGLSCACFLAKKGYDVEILEKNDTLGGRARIYQDKGFTWDMGPSWYWMPDIFERFFNCFDKKVSDYYKIHRLNPSYTIKFKDDVWNIPANMNELEDFLEKIEPGAKNQLRKFLGQAGYKYKLGVGKLVSQPGISLMEYMDIDIIRGVFKMDIFTSIAKHVRKHFKDPRIIQLMEFPILFLGATAKDTPALYTLMNYSDLALGTWYPEGGMYSVITAMIDLAKELNVKIHSNQRVKSFEYKNGRIATIKTQDNTHPCDIVVASSDYHHVDQQLLDPAYRNYSTKYWDSRSLAPSALIHYIGVDKKLPRIGHHTMFFDEDFNLHAKEIYKTKQWPSKPLLYCSVTSKTDANMAPEGKENLVVLIPVAPGIEDNEVIREKYFDLIIRRIENFVGEPFKDQIISKRSYAHKDFIIDYNSFKGNAYGLANTLKQTAILKPSIKNKKLKNLYYTGQLTVPGPGVPPSLISGEVVANQIEKENTIFAD